MERRDLRVCFVGDSYVAGVGDETGLGWVGRVIAAVATRADEPGAEHGAAHGIELTAYGLGIRRDTSVDVARRAAAECGPRLRPAQDARVVVAVGVNDTVLEDGRTRTTPDETRAALRRLHAEVSAAVPGVALLVVGPPAVDDDAQVDRLREREHVLSDESAALGVPFVGCLDATEHDEVWRAAVRAGDGYHPDSTGYTRLAEILTDPLLSWLTTDPAFPPAPPPRTRSDDGVADPGSRETAVAPGPEGRSRSDDGVGGGGVVVVGMGGEHRVDVVRIYGEGIATGDATFESRTPTWVELDAKLLPEHRLVAVADGEVLGWAGATATSTRAVYRGVVELSLYVSERARGQGVGTALMRAFLASADAGGIWTVQSGVFPENAGSLALHAAAGFRVVGRRERIGLMTHGPHAGRWRDILLLERRAP
ncbi:GNAT family N-acetyltransferase [Cellulomonas palmilytica]|uniref:GNAT family N-acetyltransferase n=1 Tax=Cellulomonas palmilytica TaxID=2608402 RepID=UPI00294FEFEC|nr:GNAT family N-acetyltransferase [Cellulomonas palmilytica]UJP40377.1 GNAT family N-acetyltransferase [Cellulomonas palmilytica]